MRLLLVLLLLLAGLPAQAAVVFMYHRFGEQQLPATNVHLEQFEAHLDYLERHDYSVWPLERIAEHLRRGVPLPDRVVAITIDDAYASVYREAYPRLKSRSLPFTVFVSSGPVDRGLDGYMSWEQMRQMQRHGARFANHSAGHAHLVRRGPGESEAQWRRRVAADVAHAERRLREELGTAANPGRLFAYPYGEYSRALADLLAAEGYLAFGQHSGGLGAGASPQALPRYPVNEHYADLEGFGLKAASLPLPLRRVTPWEPLRTSAEPPRLELALADELPRWQELRCYLGGEPLEVSWPAPGELVRVQARQRLPAGRSRYNCTVPAGDARWHWYSHLWITPGGDD